MIEAMRRTKIVATLGPASQNIVADLVAQARKNSGMNGEPGGWPQPR